MSLQLLLIEEKLSHNQLWQHHEVLHSTSCMQEYPVGELTVQYKVTDLLFPQVSSLK